MHSRSLVRKGLMIIIVCCTFVFCAKYFFPQSLMVTLTLLGFVMLDWGWGAKMLNYKLYLVWEPLLDDKWTNYSVGTMVCFNITTWCSSNYYYRFSVYSPCSFASKSSLLLFISPYGVGTASCVNGRNEQLDGNNGGDNTTKCWDEVNKSKSWT